MSCLDYCNSLYYGIGEKLLQQLQLIQNAASKSVTGKRKHDSINEDLNTLHWLSVKKRIIFKILLLVYKCLNGLAPSYLQNLLHYESYGSKVRLHVPLTYSSYGSRAFSVAGPKLYNLLPTKIKESSSLQTFKKSLKCYLFTINNSQLQV